MSLLVTQCQKCKLSKNTPCFDESLMKVLSISKHLCKKTISCLSEAHFPAMKSNEYFIENVLCYSFYM